MHDILAQIVENKKKEITKSKSKLSLEEIKSSLRKSDRSFLNSLKGRNNIIAEIKYKSPSAGKIGKKRSIKEIVCAYDKYASAISILTDKKFFAGDLKYINKAKKYTLLPILRKDFLIDEYQVYESRYFGADAILLIASILSEEEIEKMLKIARELGMDALVETKNEEEVKKVLNTSAKIIGINNRDLTNFKINLDATKKLKQLIPADRIIVSESGIYTKEDILGLNTNAVLIGTSLIEAENIAEKLASVRRCKVKVCGITNMGDANNAIVLGADILGFNFYEKSPRYITPEDAREIIKELPNTAQTAGVFVNSSKEGINRIQKITKIDYVQIHGDETEEFCAKLGTNAINAIRIKNNLPKPKTLLYARLYDKHSKSKYGGTGETFNPKILANTKGKTIIAGGMRAENIKELLSTTKPYCIDVCSGVEKEPGRKDYQKTKEFIETVRKNDN